MHTNRGTGGDAAILEEAAYVRPELVYQVVLPTLSTGCSLIAISTISPDESNFLSKMVEAKDARGNPLLNTLNMKMVCETCERRGLELTCKHKLGQLPQWQQRGRHDDIQRLMATQGDESTFLVEMRGIVADGQKKPAFNAKAMRELMTGTEKIYVHDGSDIRHIFVALDPHGGGAQSEYAVTSAFYIGEKMIICGAEAGSYTEQRSCANLLAHHIMALRKIPGAEASRIVFIPESNLGFEALWATQHLAMTGLTDNLRVMQEDANRAGVKTNRTLKHDMVVAFNMRLNMGNVYTMADFVSVGDSKHTPEEMRDRLLGQLKDFMRIVKPPRDPYHGSPTVSYSGKDGHGFDDLCMSLLLGHTMRSVFWSNQEKYRDFY